MQSGKEFRQFDSMTDKEAKEAIAAMDKRVGMIESNIIDKQSFQKYQEQVSKDMWEHETKISQLQVATNNLQTEHASTSKRLCTHIDLTEAFLKSRFVRFLNFFARWYIYGYDGHVYLNTPENKHMRPTTLRERLHNWLLERLADKEADDEEPDAILTFSTEIEEETPEEQEAVESIAKTVNSELRES